MKEPSMTEELKNKRLAAYGCVIRGDDDTSEDQVAIAADPEMAAEIVDRWNAYTERLTP